MVCLYCSYQSPGGKAKECKQCLFLFFFFFLVLLSVIAELLTKSDLIIDKCRSIHYHLPYRWQVFNGFTWNDLSMMEEIEKAYCDPKMNRYADSWTRCLKCLSLWGKALDFFLGMSDFYNFWLMSFSESGRNVQRWGLFFFFSLLKRKVKVTACKYHPIFIF